MHIAIRPSHGAFFATATDLLRVLWPSRSASRHHVDVRELPDHLKRDLGLLDGSRPFGAVKW